MLSDVNMNLNTQMFKTIPEKAGRATNPRNIDLLKTTFLTEVKSCYYISSNLQSGSLNQTVLRSWFTVLLNASSAKIS